jgi:hypothetical protein
MLLSDPESAHSEQMLSFLEKYSKLGSPILRKSGERMGHPQKSQEL